MTIALIGSTTEPKASTSSTNVTAKTYSAIQGSRADRKLTWSRLAAVRPPTSTSAPSGAGRSRTCRTTSLATSEVTLPS